MRDIIKVPRLDTSFSGRRHDCVKKLFLPAVFALLTGCTNPSGAPLLPIKPAPATPRYDNERADDLDHDLSRTAAPVPSAATA